MDLFDIVVARKLSDGGGGGGSSDFSTATVACNLMSAVKGCFTSSLPIAEESMTDASYYDGEYGNQLILYKGCAVIDVSKEVVSTSGLIEHIKRGTYMVTGDCTITVTEEPSAS